MKRIIALCVSVILCFAVFAGCSAAVVESSASASASVKPTAEETASAKAGKTVTDMAGAEVEIASAEKIVSLSPSGTEIVCALGAAKRLIGIDAFSNYPELTQSVEVVGDFNGPDVEKIVSLEPDVVLAGNTLQKEAIDNMKKLGITVVSVEATAFEDIAKSIELVGNIVDAQNEAKQVIGEIDAAVTEAQKNKPKEPKSVYYAMSYGDAGNWTSGPGSFINTMIELAGGKCVTEGQAAPWIEYPMEDLMVANPNIILADASMGSVGDISAAQGYKDIDAVKNGAVYAVNADVFTRPGPRIAEAITQLSEIINK
ncbi:MAG: helical backbone metal receptor [Christensenella sp.]